MSPSHDSSETFSTKGTFTPALSGDKSTMPNAFLIKYPNTRYIHFQWIDYTGMRRMRVVPVATVQKLLKNNRRLGISKAVFSLCQNDFRTADINVVGQWVLSPDWTSLRTCEGHTPGHATLSCFFSGDPEDVGHPDEVAVCPRTALQKAIDRAKAHGIDILVGFETEVVFLELETFEKLKGVHAWSAAGALNPKRMACLDEIMNALQDAGIDVHYLHAESCKGQFELITGPLPPLQAADALYATRETIENVAFKHGFRATLHPKPFPDAAGTATHTHMSTSKPGSDAPFFAGVMEHLGAVVALTQSCPVSYDRVADGCWAGGTYNTWGDHNREAPLRRSSEKDRHWEVRCVDGTANMYLALTAIISAGILGIEQDMKLKPACEVDPATLNDRQRKERGLVDRLPRSLPEALAALAADTELVELIGKPVFDQFMSVKQAEMTLFQGMSSEEKWRFVAEAY